MLKRGREDVVKEEDPVKVDRELERKYGMAFEEFYEIVETLRENEFVERGFEFEEIYDDFGRWLEAARNLGKLRRAEEGWVRVFP